MNFCHSLKGLFFSQNLFCLGVLLRSSPFAERPSRLGMAPHAQLFSRVDVAEQWLMKIVDQYCDVQPDEAHVHLPFGRKQDVYDLYKR
jgi:hypothetical protein